MASRPTAHHWEAPKFSFNSPNQAADWQSFYTRALDFLEALDIDPEVADQNKCRWRQIKMMFEGEDCQALKTLINNNTVTPEAQEIPAQALKAIQSVIKKDVHFWHHVISSFQIFASCLRKGYTHCQTEYEPQLPNASFPAKRSRTS